MIGDWPHDRVVAFAEGAACNGLEHVYTAEAGHITTGSLRAMQSMCAECPVLLMCMQYAQQIKPTAGVWAGILYTDHGISERTQGVERRKL